MGWRDTGRMLEPRPERIQTCDVCGKDIGVNAYRSKEHFGVSIQPGTPADDLRSWDICSTACLRVFAQSKAPDVG